MENCVLHMRGYHVSGRCCVCIIMRWQLTGLGHQLNTDQERNQTSQGRFRDKPLENFSSSKV